MSNSFGYYQNHTNQTFLLERKFDQKKYKDLYHFKQCKLSNTNKHDGDIESISECNWPSMICDNDYIEAVVADDILSNHIDSIRMSRKEDDSYYDILFRDFYSELSDDEKYVLGALKSMRELLAQQEIKLEIL